MTPVPEIKAPRSTGSPPGMLQRALRRMLMRSAIVSECETIGEHFRLATLEGEQLCGAGWVPGQKIQIAIGAGFSTRTYTPFEWDEVAARARILAYIHGDAPGSRWARNAAPGDHADVFGPRGSIDTGRIAGPLAIFGDETSLGLACALQSSARHHIVESCFETSLVDAAGNAADRLALRDVKLFARATDDMHIEAMEAELPALAAGRATFVLTGKASTIQRLRQTLRRLDVASSRVLSKAYWAPGKAGLD